MTFPNLKNIKLHYNLLLITIFFSKEPYTAQAIAFTSHKPINTLSFHTTHVYDTLPSYSKRNLLLTTSSPNVQPSTLSLKKREKEEEEEKLKYKKMHINAEFQRPWLSSMIIPGLGQIYNKSYWKVPVIYLGFIVIGKMVYNQCQELNKHKLALLSLQSSCNNDNNSFSSPSSIPNSLNEGKKTLKPNEIFRRERIGECRRARNLYIMITAAWYILFILDAYAGAHNRTISFADDIATLPPAPTPPVGGTAQSTGFTPIIDTSFSIYL